MGLELILKHSECIEKETQDKVKLWILRIIINLEGHKKLIDEKNNLTIESIEDFFDFQLHTELKKDVMDILKSNLLKLENKDKFTTLKILEKNLRDISELMGLNNYESKILEFVILLKQYPLLNKASVLLGDKLNGLKVMKALSVILDIPYRKIHKAFLSTSKIVQISLINLSGYNYDFNGIISLMSNNFYRNMVKLDGATEDIFNYIIKPCSKCHLSIKNYSHIQKSINILISYLKNSIALKKNGVNILLHGLPGTGKTELTKMIAKVLKTKLFEVSYTNSNNNPIDGNERLNIYKIAQDLSPKKNIILMYSGAEDILSSYKVDSYQMKQTYKTWISRMLETNNIPTIWITSDISSVDNGLIGRFDMSIEVPIPDKSQREKIISKYTNNILSKDLISKIAQHKDIAPALISRAVKVVKNIDTENKSDAFITVMNNSLKAQGFDELKTTNLNDLPNTYDPNFINTTMNLEELVMGIKETKNIRLCLYGASGTGKSAFGKYIAKTLDTLVILKKVSDLKSKWLGESEKNIANAFDEAKKENAVLIFDEVDSFLQDRTNAQASWEISEVNEMLVQMENFNGIFIATTNLMSSLDKASLRRFDLKLEFGYLKPTQVWNMFVLHSKKLKLTKPSDFIKSSVKNLRHLTPGDFATIVRQDRFNRVKDVNNLFERLENEILVKGIDGNNSVGFVYNVK